MQFEMGFWLMRPSDAAAVSNALSNLGRMAVFRVLMAQTGSSSDGGLTASALSQAINMASSTVSVHLKDLKAVGLVTVRRKGRLFWYSANREVFRAWVSFLSATEAES